MFSLFGSNSQKGGFRDGFWKHRTLPDFPNLSKLTVPIQNFIQFISDGQNTGGKQPRLSGLGNGTGESGSEAAPALPPPTIQNVLDEVEKLKDQVAFNTAANLRTCDYAHGLGQYGRRQNMVMYGFEYGGNEVLKEAVISFLNNSIYQENNQIGPDDFIDIHPLPERNNKGDFVTPVPILLAFAKRGPVGFLWSNLRKMKAVNEARRAENKPGIRFDRHMEPHFKSKVKYLRKLMHLAIEKLSYDPRNIKVLEKGAEPLLHLPTGEKVDVNNLPPNLEYLMGGPFVHPMFNI